MTDTITKPGGITGAVIASLIATLATNLLGGLILFGSWGTRLSMLEEESKAQGQRISEMNADASREQLAAERRLGGIEWQLKALVEQTGAILAKVDGRPIPNGQHR